MIMMMMVLMMMVMMMVMTIMMMILYLVGGVESGEVVGVSTLPQLLLAGLVGEMGGRGEEEGEGEGDDDILLNSSSCCESLAESAARSSPPTFPSLVISVFSSLSFSSH